MRHPLFAILSGELWRRVYGSLESRQAGRRVRHPGRETRNRPWAGWTPRGAESGGHRRGARLLVGVPHPGGRYGASWQDEGRVAVHLATPRDEDGGRLPSYFGGRPLVTRP